MPHSDGQKRRADPNGTTDTFENVAVVFEIVVCSEFGKVRGRSDDDVEDRSGEWRENIRIHKPWHSRFSIPLFQ
jgi:hypothetical protein